MRRPARTGNVRGGIGCRLACMLVLAVACVAGCQDSCATLAHLACEKHGEDTAVCVSRQDDADGAGPARKRLCTRALVLYKSLPGAGQ